MLSPATNETMQVQLRVIIPYLHQISATLQDSSEFSNALKAVNALRACYAVLDDLRKREMSTTEKIDAATKGIDDIE